MLNNQILKNYIRMKKFFKYFGITLVVLLIALVSVPFLFKDKLIELAKTEINKQVNATINFGEFDLTIFTYFPNLNFEIENVSVVGKDKFEGDTLMFMKKFSAKVDVMSVMGDQIKVLGIKMIEPQIYAHVLPDSSANWDITIPTDSVETPEAAEDTAASSFRLALKEFSIEKAQIRYLDESGDLSTDIKNLDYTLRGDMSADNAKLDMNMLIEAITVEMEGIKYLNQVKMAYKAGIDADLNKMKFDLLDNEFSMNQLILSFAGFFQMNEDDSYLMDLKFGTNKNQFKDILSLVPGAYIADYANVKTSGALQLDGFAKGSYSETKLPAFGLNLKIDNAMVQYPDLPAAITGIFVDLKVDNADGIDDHTIIDLKRFDLNMAGNPFSARYLAKTPVSDPYIDGYIKGKIDFDKLKTIVPLDSMSMSGLMTMDLTMKGHMSTIEQERYDEFDAKGFIKLENFLYKAADLTYDVNIAKTEFEFTPKYVSLIGFDAKVGKSDFKADGRIDNFLAYYFRDDVLSGTFNLNSNLIDANELMGPEEETAAVTDTAAEAPMTVVELPKNIKFNLNTNIGKILYDTYVIEKFTGNVALNEGVADMNPVNMLLADGQLAMKGRYDSRDAKAPLIDINFKMIDFDIKKTFNTFNTVKKLAPIGENCSGDLSLDFDLKATLDEHMEPIQKTMNGGGKIKSKQMVIGGSKALEQLAGLIKNDKYKQLTINNIDGNFKIEEGNIILSPVEVKLNNSKATFGGKQGIDQSMDYLLTVNIPRSDLGAANQLIDGLMAKGGDATKNIKLGDEIKVDVFITGTFDKPKFSIGSKDMANDLKDQVKEQVKEKVLEVANDAKEKAVAEARKQAEALMVQADEQSAKLIAESEKQAQAIRDNGKKAAQKAREEADIQINKLVAEAGSNPIAKAAAKESGKRLKAEADKKAAQMEVEANKKADQLVEQTKKQSDGIKQKAKEQGDKLIDDAEKKEFK